MSKVTYCTTADNEKRSRVLEIAYQIARCHNAQNYNMNIHRQVLHCPLNAR
jgi:hypothetical protein